LEKLELEKLPGRLLENFTGKYWKITIGKITGRIGKITWKN